jgi:hypothetical protein
MKNMNDIVNKLVEDIDIPEDVPVFYEVWAIGYDEEDELTGASMILSTFNDPDMAVDYAKALTLADVVNLAADDEYADLTVETHSISIEVETVVPSIDEDDMNMNVGTIYKKRLEIFEELPQYVPLSADDFELLENGDIQVPCEILKDYNKNECFTAIFEDGSISQPMIYKIISKTTDGYYICEFV